MRVSAKNFKPKVRGKSDKFSWNLYRLLKDWEGREISVVRIGWNTLDGGCDISRGSLYICCDLSVPDWMHGNQIVRVMCEGPKAANVAFGMMGSKPWHHYDREDVTEWFFREYADKGRCLLVPNWSHDWIEINVNARKCRHCGKHERREVYTKRTAKRIEAWA